MTFYVDYVVTISPLFPFPFSLNFQINVEYLCD
jgi:hypothetical protein